MADSVSNVLRLKYKTASDKTKTINVSNVVDEPAEEDVTALVGAVVENKAIYADQPTEAVSAQLIATTVTDYDIE